MADTLSIYRSEQKYLISYPDAVRLKTRLGAFLCSDEHGKQGAYRVKSLYYDTPDGRDYREKPVWKYPDQMRQLLHRGSIRLCLLTEARMP